jgi:hypothetical protein
MKTAEELLSDLNEALVPIENDYLSIKDYAHLLQGVTSGREVHQEHVPGIYRLLFEIVDRAEAIRKHHDTASQILHRLRHP